MPAAAVDRFLEDHRQQEVIALVLSVPAVHLPRLAARLLRRLPSSPADFGDRWSTAGHVHDRNWLLDRLHQQQRRCPAQRILLLSGDIHIACAHELSWTDGTNPILQLVSSGITHRERPFIRWASGLMMLLNRRLRVSAESVLRVRRLRGAPGRDRNPYADLNMALIGFERRPDRSYDIDLSIWGTRDGDPVCRFRSAPIRAPRLP